MLRDAGWQVNAKRVERLWRREGLKVPQKQPKKRRLWLHDGSCVRLRPAHRDHIWSYDFVHHRTGDGQAFRILNILDEYTRECLLIRVRRKLASWDVLEALSELFLLRGVPGFIRSDNGPEFVASHVRRWVATVGAETAYIEPGSPWENGDVESFNARFRDELLDREIFTSLRQASIRVWCRSQDLIGQRCRVGLAGVGQVAAVGSHAARSILSRATWALSRSAIPRVVRVHAPAACAG